MGQSCHLKRLVEKGDKWQFWLFLFSRSKLAECVHVAFTSVEKHYPVIFFRWLALRFWEISYVKKVRH